MPLTFVEAIRRLPDFVVMNSTQTKKYFVEVKYRDKFDRKIFECEKRKSQVRVFKEIFLVCVNGSAPDAKGYGFAERFIRGCRLTHDNKKGFIAHLRYNNTGENPTYYEKSFDKMVDDKELRLIPLDQVGPHLVGYHHFDVSNLELIMARDRRRCCGAICRV